MKLVLTNEEVKEIVKEHVRHILGEVVGDKELTVSGAGYGEVEVEVVDPIVNKEE